MPKTHGKLPGSSKQEIERLIKIATERARPDAYAGKRESTRFATGMQLDATTDPKVPSCAWPVTMHNISEGGLSFWSKRQLRQGAVIYVREFSANGSSHWLAARVTHCTVGIKGFLIGAAFETPPV